MGGKMSRGFTVDGGMMDKVLGEIFTLQVSQEIH